MDVAQAIGDVAKMIVPKRTGMLMASIEASRDGDDALVGPTASARSFNGPYGRAVELGGWREAHNSSGYMWWPTGIWSHHAAGNMMPSQPYLKPAADIVEATTSHRIYYDHWLRAQQGL